MSHDVSIVTAFFDIGRGSWDFGGHTSAFRRSNEQYLNWFANFASLKNSMVVFTETQFAERVIELRRRHGLKSETKVVVVDDLFAHDGPLATQLSSIRTALRPQLHSMVHNPAAPEHWNPNYLMLCLLKTVLVCTTIKLGLNASPQVAWIDFGYCRDDQRFDPNVPWRFDCRGRMNMFYLREPDDRPIFDIVKTGDVYFQGCHLVGTEKSWFQLRHLVDESTASLLNCGLIDDDQTMLLMAYRLQPDLFHIHAADPTDWFVIFRRYHHREDDPAKRSAIALSASMTDDGADEIQKPALVNTMHTAVPLRTEQGTHPTSPDRLAPLITGNGRQDVLIAARSLASGGKIMEIGTFKAEFAERLFDACNPAKLYCVDPYVSYDGYWDISDSEKTFDEIYDEARRRMARFGDRVEFVRTYSIEAAKQFPDESLDFIYIDGNHSYRFVYDDFCIWYPKARRGALICGDDAVDTDEQRRDSNGDVEVVWLRNADGSPRSAGRYGVLKALKTFCSERGIDFHLSGSQYFFLKGL